MSTKGRYSLRAVIDIAAHPPGEAVSSRSIAEQSHMSEGYLLQLLRRLKEAGIVRSVRGVNGGYVLARPAAEITVGEIFEAAGEPVEPVECLGLRGRGECAAEEQCRAKEAWRRLNAGIVQILNDITIASLFERPEDQGAERKMDKLIYMDNAATTPARPEVVEAMLPYFTEKFGNPSSLYTPAKVSQEAIAAARNIIAESIGAKSNEIYFTAGGTESDNWAIKATAEAYQNKGRHIITTAIEHHAVLETCKYLEKHGFEITYIGVDEEGFIKMDELRAAIRPDTILISVMYANNEIGTIQPIREIGKLAREHGVLFHTDAVQAYGQIPINVDDDFIDMLSASGHKLYGPKGVGFLYIRKGLKTRSFIHGGDQERRRRAGTENVPAIVGFGRAVEVAMETMKERDEKERELRNYLIDRVLAEVPYVRLNGPRDDRLPGNASFCFNFVEGESLLLSLEKKGICVSTGSACASTSLDPSHVLLAIGVPVEIAHGSIRVTLNATNTKEEVDYVVDAIRDVVENIRSLSPLYDDFLAEQKKKEKQGE